jgi:hypothetical protein
MTPDRACALLRAHGGALDNLAQLGDDDARDVLEAFVELDVDTFTDALRAIAYGADTVLGLPRHWCETCGAEMTRTGAARAR